MNVDSPFTPNQPARAGFFTGREDQIAELLGVVERAATNKFQIAWISGERGIGKSSLASFVGTVAERDYEALIGHVHLGGVHDLQDMTRQAYFALLKDNESKSWGKKIVDVFGDRVKKVGLFGVNIELNLPKNELPKDGRGFAQSLHQILQKTEDRKVLMLILDDINGLADKPEFAHWIKSMVDSIATSGLDIPVCMFFVGLQERLDKIRENNLSTVRAFGKIAEIKPWTKAETEEFFQNIFLNNNVVVSEDYIHAMAFYSGGIPTIAHEIGDHVWKRAENNKVEKNHVDGGIKDAANSIGQRFIEGAVVQALGSKNYRSILQKISSASLEKIGIIFSRKELLSLETLTDAEKDAMDNFLRRMINVGGLISVERGKYRFPNEMHWLYFFLRATPPTE